jgi:cytochrome bd-type quinol oxidase subunit 2
MDVTAPLPMRTGRLWTGVLAAPAAWVVAEGVGYVVAARACEPSVGAAASAETAHARLLDIAICVVCLIIGVVGLWSAIANVRAARRDANDRATFLSIGGAFSSALFTAGIALFALPALIVNACNQAR